jgi:NADH-quinone oxidoreductase subunit G
VSQTGDAFVIYQGSHGDSGARLADVILPGAAYTEKDGTYVNTEGRVQLGARAVFPPGEAKEDWRIIRALSEHLGRPLPFDTLEQLRGAMYRDHPHLAEIDHCEPGDASEIQALADGAAEVTSTPFASPVESYYLTNPIARASHVMQELVALERADALGETGTDG